MRKFTFSWFLLCVVFLSAGLQSCKDDSYLAPPPPTPDQSFTEDFDTVSSSLSRGWIITNASDPKGSNIWQQGGSVNPWFRPYASNGAYAGFIGADYTSTSAAAGTISNWLISPEITMQNGDSISFYTRSYLDDLTPFGFPGDSTDWSNRLQLRLAIGGSTDVGFGTDPGKFKTNLLDINPEYIEHRVDPTLYSPFAYPAQWTRFSAVVVGLNGPSKGRFAFRYFVEGGGSNGLGSGVGIDKVAYKSVKN